MGKSSYGSQVFGGWDGGLQAFLFRIDATSDADMFIRDAKNMLSGRPDVSILASSGTMGRSRGPG